MKSSTEIYEELNSISPLLVGIEKKNVFSIPEGYFHMFSLDLIKIINTLPGKTISSKLTVPDGYFENLTTSILNKIKIQEGGPAQELRALSPMLYSIQNENVFQVPPGYFRNLENDILFKVNQPAKVITLKKKDTIWKYAVAAVVTGVIGLSTLMMFNSTRQSATDKAPGQSVSSVIKSAIEFKSEDQVKSAIASLSDEEIIKYLEKTGNEVDSEVLATGIDGNALPSLKDYLMDENTLETYLQHNEKNSQN